MSEVVILPEMLTAGMEALAEEEKRNALPHDKVIAVFLAMRGIEEIYALRRKHFENVH